MRKKYLEIIKVGLVIITLFLLIYIFFNLKSKNQESSADICNIDSDCAPSSCCHASSCILKSQAPDCKRAICSQVCTPGTLDCNQGSCLCKNKKCETILK